MATRRGMPGLLRAVLLFAVLLGALSLVVRRQSLALEALRRLDDLRTERAATEAEKNALVRTIQRLESRGAVLSAASARLGMHVPDGSEIVILPLAEAPAAAGASGAGVDEDSGRGGEAEPGGAEALRATTLVGVRQW